MWHESQAAPQWIADLVYAPSIVLCPCAARSATINVYGVLRVCNMNEPTGVLIRGTHPTILGSVIRLKLIAPTVVISCGCKNEVSSCHYCRKL